MRHVFGIMGCVAMLCLSGCVSVPYPSSGDQWGLAGRGVYHPVGKGETIWRISRVYGVPLESIVRVNRIDDPSEISAGQRLFIPGATEVIAIEGALNDIKDENFVRPVTGNVVAGFGSPSRSYRNHGIQIKAPAEAPVKAVRLGKVVFADYLPGYGQTVIVDHQDGLSSVYSGEISIEKSIYDDVEADDILARVKGGNTIVYFELRRNGVPDNPLFYLPKM